MPRKPDPALDVECTQCGKTFHTNRQRLKKNKKGNFCCSPCYDLFRKRTGYNKPPPSKPNPALDIDCICVQCGKDFRRKRYNLPPKYGPFCCHKCYGKWRKENLVGEASPVWKGGHTMEYGGSHWKRQRRRARERDNHTCQDCGMTEQAHGYKLDVHHLVPYDMFKDPKEANRLENLVTLCRQCHTDMVGHGT